MNMVELKQTSKLFKHHNGVIFVRCITIGLLVFHYLPPVHIKGSNDFALGSGTFLMGLVALPGKMPL